ncbi:MAG TPA: C39 family peptidase [Burkholderiaceae bacterium]|nr:C39 family peptidase [Burkholderiaceae bacterium]
MDQKMIHLQVLMHYYMGVLPAAFEGGRLGKGTSIHDVNGEELYARFPVVHGKESFGWVDVASHPVFGAPVLGGAAGAEWNPDALIAAAGRAARKTGLRKWSSTRFVAYSFPKLAVQFLGAEHEELLMLELHTWAHVPERRQREADEPPGNFERWSLIEETPPKTRRTNERAFKAAIERVEKALGRLLPKAGAIPLDRDRIVTALGNVFPLIRIVSDSRELHFSTRNADHDPCFELRGQETNVWCVGASVQMVLDFYRYQYTQTRIAVQLGLGTPSNPNGLPYTRDGDVVTALQAMSSNALTAAMNTTPTFDQYRNEILANRPLISFIPGHSRAVAGYTRTRLLVGPLAIITYRGLLVYDPWPPNAGVITRWENFDTSTYRRTFSAHVTTI